MRKNLCYLAQFSFGNIHADEHGLGQISKTAKDQRQSDQAETNQGCYLDFYQAKPAKSSSSAGWLS